MAEEKPNNTEAPTAKEVVVTEAISPPLPPERETDPEPQEDPKKPLQESTPVAEPEVVALSEEKKKPTSGVSLAVAFREESNIAPDLPNPEKKALDELKQLLQSALTNGDFSPVPPPPLESAPSLATGSAELKAEEDLVTEGEKEKWIPVDDDGAKTVEAIAETVVPVAASPAKVADVAEEEVFIWGVPLLGDARSDTVLLKFLHARDLKAKEAVAMIKNTVAWRRDFGVEGLLQENLGVAEMEKVVFMSGVDRVGHPVCYNSYGEFQNGELYAKAFGDEETKQRFVRWLIQYVEKGIRQLIDFKPGSVSTMVQVADLKNAPVSLIKEFRQVLGLLLDNYPEFVEKQLFVNVPWWYLAFNRMISPFLTQRTKSKFVYAGPSKSADTLFRYIAAEQVPLQFGGLHSENNPDFTISDAATVINIKPSSKQIVEIPVTGQFLLVWELRVLEWDVSYSAEFVPNSNESYTVIVQKARKMVASDEAVVKSSFKGGEPGKILFTLENNSNKRKILLYRFKFEGSESS